jgi:hypothetical protein
MKTRQVYVRATVLNVKIGKSSTRIYMVTLNGFMSLHDAVKEQINRNERIEHVEAYLFQQEQAQRKDEVAPTVDIWV